MAFQRYIGVDLETTGLNPSTDEILEIGMVLFDKDLNPVDQLVVVAPTVPGMVKVTRGALSPFIVEMHTQNGLLDDIHGVAEGLGPDELSHYGAQTHSTILRLLGSWIPDEDWGKMPLLGSSVHFDRNFLEAHMPQLMAPFSHRNVDASSFQHVARMSDPEAYDEVMATIPESDHRSLADVMRSAAIIKAIAGRAWL